MKALFIFFSILLPSMLNAQKLYQDSMYQKVTISAHKYATVEGENLEMDFYRPVGAEGKMPVVVYVHGGGFNSGSRNTQGIQLFAKRLAKRGYAVLSVSYRLTLKDKGTECEIPTELKQKAIISATEDLTLAIQYMITNTSLFPIKKDKIILAGSSAGAEAVLHLAYGHDYSKQLGELKFAGVIGIAGAIMDKDYIKEENAIPTQLFHGTSDVVVPYGSASHQSCRRLDPGYFQLHGSKIIAAKLKELEKPYYLYTINQGTHAWAGVPTKRCFNEISDFLYNDVLFPKMMRQTERVVTE
ncbi:MAG: alpha/beta hydrolase [bacterium]|nr:alpha/beta hydrolase [bacterium]